MGNIQNKQVSNPNDQQNTNDILKSLGQLSTNALLCGPDCQKQKTLTNLEQIYIKAQNEVVVAPVNLQTAKKNYYVFSQGETGYNNMLEQELKKKVDGIAISMTNLFNNEIQKAHILNSYLNNDIINSKNTVELYKTYLSKNKTIEKEIKNSHGDILTNDRKSYYEIQENDNLKGWYNIFVTSYFIIALVYFGRFILLNNNLSYIIKIIIVILLIIFPYIIDPVTVFIFSLFSKIFSLLPKDVYSEPKDVYSRSNDVYK
jgi:hypothetical protein